MSSTHFMSKANAEAVMTAIKEKIDSIAGSEDGWTATATVDANNQVTFTGLSDGVGYAIYCQNKIVSVLDVTKTTSNDTITLVYTLSGVTTGDVCKLRTVGSGEGSGGGGGGSHTYSTTEQVVGTWIDGKPVYEKTLTGTITSGDGKISDLIPNTDTIVSVTGFANNPSWGGVNIGGYCNGSVYAQVFVNYGNTPGIFLYVSGYSVGGTFSITIRYTKTTD